MFKKIVTVVTNLCIRLNNVSFLPWKALAIELKMFCHGYGVFYLHDLFARY